MSILIKGMEMPSNCPSCPFNSRAWYEDSHLCLASNKQITVNLRTGFDDNCPLVPVPPHGRLVDADRLLSEHMKQKYYYLPNGDIAIPIIDVEHAPTIIEAEEVNT